MQIMKRLNEDELETLKESLPSKQQDDIQALLAIGSKQQKAAVGNVELLNCEEAKAGEEFQSVQTDAVDASEQ